MKYLAQQMQNSTFDEKRYPNFRYGMLGLMYQPNAASVDPTDQIWRRICMVYGRIRQLAYGGVVLSSARVLDEKTRQQIISEAQKLGSSLHDLDSALAAKGTASLTEQELGKLDDDVRALSFRTYLLAACTISAFRVTDLSGELKNMGFLVRGAEVGLGGPTTVIFSMLFIVLLVFYLVVGSLLRGSTIQSIMPFSFGLRCFAVAALVLSLGLSAYTAASYRDGVNAKLRGRVAEKLVTYAKMYLYAFVVALVVLFVMNLPFHVGVFTIRGFSWDDFNFLISFSATHAISPAAGGLLACVWIDASKGRSSVWIIGVQAVVSALVLGSLSVSSTYLFLAQSNTPIPRDAMLNQMLFDFGQWAVAGVAIAMLSAVLRSYEAATTGMDAATATQLSTA
jgi:hypothetical protein